LCRIEKQTNKQTNKLKVGKDEKRL
jgi:hypothetical protein